MRRSVRIVCLLFVLFLIATACSKPRKEQVSAQKTDEGVNTLVGGVDGESAAPIAPDEKANANPVGKAVVPVSGAKGAAAHNPLADASHTKRVGAAVKPRSTAVPNGNRNTWAGVTDKEIKLVFSIDEEGCGVNVLNAAQQAGGNFATESRFFRKAATDQQTLNAERRESTEILVKYWNDTVLDFATDFTQIRPLMGEDRTHPFFGRRMTYQIIDGGSFQCPDKTTAAAVKIVQEIKPFSVITDDIPAIDGSGFNMASALHAKAPASSRPMLFGALWYPDSEYTKWSPFVWSQFTSSTFSARTAATYICGRLDGRPAVNAQTPALKSATRKFGLAYPNTVGGKQTVADFKAEVEKSCGKQIISPDAEFAYSDDVSRAGDEATQMMVKFKLLGVTSVINFNSFFYPLLQIVAAKGQDYKPEWVWPCTAYVDTSTVQRLYDQEMVNKSSFGVTCFGQLGGFYHGAGDAFYVYHRYHKVSPTSKKACDPSSDAGMSHDSKYCKAPGPIVTLYYSHLPLLHGLFFAGPNLTPKNVTDGLQAYPETRYGINGPTDDPRAVLVGSGPGKHYFITDASEFRWRSNYLSPAPESKPGWVEWPDCQRHYVSWKPEKVALQWEKSGPAWNAWCGDAKYAPKDSPDKDNYPKYE